MRLRVLLPALLPALVLAACEKAPPPRAVQPTFYQDLSGAGSQVDQVKALAMINEYRAKSGAGPLKLDPELGRIAREYAATMAAADKMSHQVTASDKLGDRLRAQGYEFAAAGENIAAGYRTLAEAFSGWRQSPPHDRGMKDRDMTLMGIGTAVNPNSKYKVFWSLIFARPKDVAGTPGVTAVPSVLTVHGVPLPE